MKHQLILSCAVLSILGASSLSLAADAKTKPATIDVVSTDGQGNPVAADIFRREGENTVRLGRGVSELKFNEANCAFTVSFTAVPINKSLWTYPADDWRACFDGQDFKFHFGKNISIAKSKVFLAYALGNGGVAGVDLGPIGDDPTLKPGIGVLKSLASDGDLGSVSYVSNEMSVALARRGRTTQAEYFRVLALTSGLDSVANAQVDREGPACDTCITSDYWSTTSKDDLIYSDAAKKIIEQYQKDTGLTATGRMDWATVKSTSALASADIDALDGLKRTATAAIKY